MLLFFNEYHLAIGVGILCVLAPVLWWRKRSLSYLLFFSIFWLYLLAVVAVVIFPIAINADQSAAAFIPAINLIPFYFGQCQMLELCVRSIIENIVLTVPFGFGIN